MLRRAFDFRGFLSDIQSDGHAMGNTWRSTLEMELHLTTQRRSDPAIANFNYTRPRIRSRVRFRLSGFALEPVLKPVHRRPVRCIPGGGPARAGCTRCKPATAVVLESSRNNPDPFPTDEFLVERREVCIERAGAPSRQNAHNLDAQPSHVAELAQPPSLTQRST